MFCTGVLVPYDDSFTKKVPVLVEFHKKHVAKELITRAIKNTQDKDQGEEDVELFCYCQTPYDDSKPYVGCDDVHCNYKWIHCTCAKVKKTRKGQPWYCKYCKRKNNSEDDKTLSSYSKQNVFRNYFADTSRILCSLRDCHQNSLLL